MYALRIMYLKYIGALSKGASHWENIEDMKEINFWSYSLTWDLEGFDSFYAIRLGLVTKLGKLGWNTDLWKHLEHCCDNWITSIGNFFVNFVSVFDEI